MQRNVVVVESVVRSGVVNANNNLIKPSDISKMSGEKESYSLPPGPKDLCFNVNEFVKSPFSVDEFLQNQRRNANLETMRDDLGIYLKVLRSAMIELINKDYADFVNLSSNLIGLDKAINKIQVPLGQLKEEVWQVKSNLDEAIEDLSACLNKKYTLRRNKQSLHSLSYMQQSIQNLSSLLHLPAIESTKTGNEAQESEDGKPGGKKVELTTGPDLIERVAFELNQLYFKISQCRDLMAPKYSQRLADIESTLDKNLNELFLISVRNSDLETMRRCLHVYESLGKAHAAEELFQKQIVAQELHEVISESSLQRDPEGLKGVYTKVLKFIDEHMKDLLEFTSLKERGRAISGFQFLVNSFWPEVEKRLELHMSSIFAPGNPDHFFQCYTVTQWFLQQVEQKCGSQADVKRLHENKQYQAFLHLWNLPVYFQIRFQEIGGGLENALFNWIGNVKAKNGRFKLSCTNSTWSAVEECWNQNIVIPQIAHRFWKLTLQIIARYYTWTAEAVQEKWPEMGNDHMARLPFLVLLVCDIESLAASLTEILDMASSSFQHLSPNCMKHCEESLSESANLLLSRLPAVTERIVSEVSAASGASLRQVGDIPRLFRRTNREVPTRPCTYMSSVLAPLLAFHNDNKDCVRGERLHEWLTLICSAITCQLYVCVSDVLTSVQKTEESLRRLKKMRERGAPSTSAEGRGVSDDDKIRMQLFIDVSDFCQEVEKLGVSRSEVERLQDLITLAENASLGQPQLKAQLDQMPDATQ